MRFFQSAPFAITMGDPCGIGPEIIVKMFADIDFPSFPLVILGDVGVMNKAIQLLGSPKIIIKEVGNVSEVKEYNSSDSDSCVLPVLQCGRALSGNLIQGVVSREAGAAAYIYIEQAAQLAMEGKIAGIVTAPISKEALFAAGHGKRGHTEILADYSGSRRVGMMLVNDEIRVLLASVHVPLAQAIQAVICENELESIHLAKRGCEAFGILHPRIAVAGLNPHAGEKGLYGKEEENIIAPTVRIAREQGIDVSGPWPADTVFMRARRGEFDVVVAQYHDQGLIPIKYNGVDCSANITVGLPFIRTSVAHGTAFDIAWSGKANHKGLLYALKKGVELFSVLV